jgi:hypothetical protein
MLLFDLVLYRAVARTIHPCHDPDLPERRCVETIMLTAERGAHGRQPTPRRGVDLSLGWSRLSRA